VNIIVCLKQVPDTESQIKVGSDGTSIVTDDIKWVMNPYDEFGVEEALRLKEKHGGEVTVVGLGAETGHRVYSNRVGHGGRQRDSHYRRCAGGERCPCNGQSHCRCG
jgi:electron transfer flavoprotein alpha/beta subunit